MMIEKKKLKDINAKNAILMFAINVQIYIKKRNYYNIKLKSMNIPYQRLLSIMDGDAMVEN